MDITQYLDYLDSIGYFDDTTDRRDDMDKPASLLIDGQNMGYQIICVSEMKGENPDTHAIVVGYRADKDEYVTWRTFRSSDGHSLAFDAGHYFWGENARERAFRDAIERSGY